jgi:hypothetical protein
MIPIRFRCPFVIPLTAMFTGQGVYLGEEDRLLFSNYRSWKHAPPFVISTGAPQESSGEIAVVFP